MRMDLRLCGVTTAVLSYSDLWQLSPVQRRWPHVRKVGEKPGSVGEVDRYQVYVRILTRSGKCRAKVL